MLPVVSTVISDASASWDCGAHTRADTGYGGKLQDTHITVRELAPSVGIAGTSVGIADGDSGRTSVGSVAGPVAGPVWGQWQDQCGDSGRTSVGTVAGPVWGQRQDQCGDSGRTSVGTVAGPVWGQWQDQCGVSGRTSVGTVAGPVWGQWQDQCGCRMVRESGTVQVRQLGHCSNTKLHQVMQLRRWLASIAAKRNPTIPATHKRLKSDKA